MSGRNSGGCICNGVAIVVTAFSQYESCMATRQFSQPACIFISEFGILTVKTADGLLKDLSPKPDESG